ncbi:response regulator transcription factor [Parablautia intestinalis]|uniref:response regulator transcription factor n=1 Tax=Parablautia intestinalis TaxID=2320100 RepID=UPI0023C97878|nr:response regulator [Parablautia intestinalis]MDE7047430.1 response regulator [Lachnospiraceae bacterium]
MIPLLIVDDEIASVKILQKFIPFKEYNLELIGIAGNGSDALKYLNSSNPPEIIITDMNMPVMDGISFLQFLIDCHPEIQVIVISGYYNYEYTHAAIKANVYDYLLKPIDRKKLSAVLQSCCEAIHNNKKLNILQTSPRFKVDIGLYQSVLKYTANLKEVLEYGNSENLDHELSLFNRMIQEQKEKGLELYCLVYKTLTDSLLTYCVENNYEDMTASIPENPADFSWETVYQLICDIYHQCLGQIRSRRMSSSTNLIVEQSYQYINNHYRENISLEMIANLFFINKEYLATIFRKKYGESVGQYIIRLKMDDAKKQLTYSNRRIEEIAEFLGYSDASYFYRQFKKEVGISPKKYRNTYSRISTSN